MVTIQYHTVASMCLGGPPTLVSNDQITVLLASARRGDADATQRVWSAIYGELRQLANQRMAGEQVGHMLQPTALINEAYLRLFKGGSPDWENRRHFFGAAARVMRQILIDYARKRKSQKRGGGMVSSESAVPIVSTDQKPIELLAVDEALDRLAEKDARQAKIVELRYFVGLTIDECAAVLGIAPRTVDKEWRFARTWLYQELAKGDSSIQQINNGSNE